MALNAQFPGQWTSGEWMRSARFEAVVAEVTGKIYVVGGYPREIALMIYDPAADFWDSGASLDQPRHHAAGGSVQGKLIVFGGYKEGWTTLVDSTYEYDPDTGAWRPCADMDEPRGALAGAVLEEKIHAVGGVVVDDDGRRVSTGKHEVYDLASDSWQTLASMRTPRDHLAVAAVGGQLYAIGGRTNNSPNNNLNVNEVYNPSTDTWQKRAPMSKARSGIAAAVLGGIIYVFGGEAPGKVFGQVEAYDPQTDSWSPRALMKTPRHGLGAVASGGRIYVIGGASDPDSDSMSNANEIFVP